MADTNTDAIACRLEPTIQLSRNTVAIALLVVLSIIVVYFVMIRGKSKSTVSKPTADKKPQPRDSEIDELISEIESL